MAFSESQRRDRQHARMWGKSAMSNICLAFKQETAAKGWEQMAQRCTERYGVDDSSAILAKERAESARSLANHQAEQAVINTRRAARAAIASFESRY